MRTFIKKLTNLFKTNIEAKSIAKKRKKENAKLRTSKKSDVRRWQNNQELRADWDERTLILGSFILPDATIIEFGSGNMVLKNHLKNYKSYTPSDVIKRFDETVVCDLNNNINFDISKFDTAIFSGVLEYVFDVDKVFNQLGGTIRQVVLSYCCTDLVKLSRDKNGWLSDYTKSDLENIFSKYGFKIENYTEWKEQSIYNLIK